MPAVHVLFVCRGRIGPRPRQLVSTPYLKGKSTQFEGKVKVWIITLLAFSNVPSPAPVPKTTVVVRTRRTNLWKYA